jgi:hypothetical protein
MTKLKNLFMNFCKSAVIAICYMIMLSHHVSSGAEYEYVKNKYGKKLGVTYKTEKVEISGELAIDKKTGKMLFISCDKTKVLDNELHMRRNGRNCSIEFSTWPSNLLKHISVTQGRPVILSGRPSKTCGVCAETPFSYVDVPDEVEIDPSILKNPDDYPPDIREIFDNSSDKGSQQLPKTPLEIFKNSGDKGGLQKSLPTPMETPLENNEQFLKNNPALQRTGGAHRQ